MKLVIATLGALTLLSAGAASAATATYSFEGATDGDVSLASALAPLGVTSSSIASATGGLIGVFFNGGNQPNATFGAKSFAIGNNGAWSRS